MSAHAYRRLFITWANKIPHLPARADVGHPFPCPIMHFHLINLLTKESTLRQALAESTFS